MRNLRDYADSLAGEYKPVKYAGKIFTNAIEKFNRLNTNDRDDFYEELCNIADMLDFINFVELFGCLYSLECNLEICRSETKHTYIKQVNSLAGIAVVDFYKELYKVYDNNNRVKEKPENFDEFIKIMLNKSKEIFA